MPKRSKLPLLTGCMDKLDRYIDHGMCEILTLNTIATTTYLQVANLDSKLDHTQNMFERVVRHTHHMQVIMVYCYIDLGS